MNDYRPRNQQACGDSIEMDRIDIAREGSKSVLPLQGKSTIGNNHRYLGFAAKDLGHGYKDVEQTPPRAQDTDMHGGVNAHGNAAPPSMPVSGRSTPRNAEPAPGLGMRLGAGFTNE